MRTKISAAQFDLFLAQPENTDRRYELVFGEVVQKMPTQLHAYIIQMLSGFLFVFLRQNPIGYALIEARYRLPDDPENDWIPDLSFVTKTHGPFVRSGPAPYFPELAVEVQSEGQSERFMLDKALLYLANGTRAVWIIYPVRQIVEVLTASDRQLLTQADQLSGGEILPGFSVAVRELFPVEEANSLT